MDDLRLGLAVRALRRRRGWRQSDLAARAGVSAPTVSRLERGRLDALQVRTIRGVAAVLELRTELVGRWRGGDLDRLVAARHAALADVVIAELRRAGWVVVPEVSYSIWGERGVIDLLAWQGAARAVAVIELKSEIADPQALAAQVNRYRRLAPRIAAEQGWLPLVVGSWAVVEETPTNRRRLAAHRELLRAAFPAGGRRFGTWLRAPTEPVAGLAFRPPVHRGTVGATSGGRRRVRPTAGRPAGPGPSVGTSPGAGGDPVDGTPTHAKGPGENA